MIDSNINFDFGISAIFKFDQTNADKSRLK